MGNFISTASLQISSRSNLKRARLFWRQLTSTTRNRRTTRWVAIRDPTWKPINAKLKVCRVTSVYGCDYYSAWQRAQTIFVYRRSAAQHDGVATGKWNEYTHRPEMAHGKRESNGKRSWSTEARSQWVARGEDCEDEYKRDEHLDAEDLTRGHSVNRSWRTQSVVGVVCR